MDQTNLGNPATMSMTLGEGRGIYDNFNYDYRVNLKRNGLEEEAKKYQDFFAKPKTEDFQEKVSEIRQQLDESVVKLALQEAQIKKEKANLIRKEINSIEQRPEEAPVIATPSLPISEEIVSEETEDEVTTGSKNIEIIKTQLKEMGVKFHHKLGNDKIISLAEENGLL